MNTETPQVPKGPFKFLLNSSRPYRLRAFVALLAVVVATSMYSIVPYVFKRIVDTVNGLSGFGPDDIWFWAFIYVLVGLIGTLGWRTSGFSGLVWATGVRKTGREMLTKYVIGHSHNFFSNRFAGAITSKLTQASEGLKNMVEAILWQWFGFFLELAISLYLVFTTDMRAGALFVMWILVVTPMNIVLFRKKIPLGKAATKSETELNANTVDVLTNINAVRDYARSAFELNFLYGLIEERRRAGAANWRFGEKAITLNNLFEVLFATGMIGSSVYLWTLGRLTAGDIILVITLFSQIRRTISGLGQQFNAFADNLSTIKEALSDILNDHEIVDAQGAKKLNVSAGEIVFNQVDFSYGDRSIFNKLDLKIKSGERVGLIGRSGAGKSTLVKLLTRQYDTTGGSVLIDGQDISKVIQNSLHEAIATVPQEPLLFHRSIKDNIRYGDLTASEEDIVSSAEQAQAHKFIDSLPTKYDTLVGERGIKLSGGEKQRVAIARAFLKRSKILLLDEATSALDSESEVLIQEALSKLMEGKTVIAIAHRLSTLRAMDRLIVMDGGKIVEDGTHEELLEKGGIYAGLWAHQAGGFIKEE